MRTIYFDYNATTSLDPAVRDAMLPYLGEVFGNPSSVHHVGRRARSLLDDARDRVAKVWAAKPSEVIFTSGGTESSNQAIFGVARLRRDKGRHIITSSVEHHAVLHACEYLGKKEGFEVTYLPASADGFVSAESLAAAIRPDTILVSIMAANNETGSIQPVAELGKVCRERGVLFHTDAVQWFGKEPFANVHQFNASSPSAPTNSTARKARARSTSARRCNRTRSSSAAATRTSAVPARRISPPSSVSRKRPNDS